MTVEELGQETFLPSFNQGNNTALEHFTVIQLIGQSPAEGAKQSSMKSPERTLFKGDLEIIKEDPREHNDEETAVEEPSFEDDVAAQFSLLPCKGAAPPPDEVASDEVPPYLLFPKYRRQYKVESIYVNDLYTLTYDEGETLESLKSIEVHYVSSPFTFKF